MLVVPYEWTREQWTRRTQFIIFYSFINNRIKGGKLGTVLFRLFRQVIGNSSWQVDVRYSRRIEGRPTLPTGRHEQFPACVPDTLQLRDVTSARGGDQGYK